MTAVAKNASTPIDELKQRIAAEQGALDDLKLEAAQLQAERQTALLADDDAPLESLETRILSNLRSGERLRARLDALLVELEAVEEEQRQMQARADYEHAARQLADAESWLLNRYAVLAAEIAEGLARLQAADRLAEQLNRELPAGSAPLHPPSHARHEPMQPERREVRKVRRWVDNAGRDLGAVQIIGGEPTVHGARMVEREEETVIPGRKPWWPAPLHSEVRLPRLHRDDGDYWMP